MRHSVDCSFCYYFHYAFLGKKSVYNFYYVHYAMVMSKKQNFISALCSQCHDHEKIVYIKFQKNILIATASTTPGSWQTSIYFYFSTTTFTTPWWWKKKTFSSIANCYYVVIMSKKYFPYSYYIHYTLIMTKIYSMFSFQHYVYYTLITRKKNFFFHFSTPLCKS